MARAFISYRRDDSGPIARALYLQLKERFGSGQLFMDVNSIQPGEPWPERIQSELQMATVILVLIGRKWLFAADQYGKRRIDDEEDWVRSEILEALARKIRVVPVILKSQKNLPVAAGLPDLLRPLLSSEALVLRLGPHEWAADVMVLGNYLRQCGLIQRDVRPAEHAPSLVKSVTPSLTDSELAAVLKELPEWEPWEDTLPQEYPLKRQELRRTFAFQDFTEAMDFMSSIAARFQKARHHPRWGNEWNIVQIRLTTWDAGNRITHYDVTAARMAEAAYRKFLRLKSKRKTNG